MTASAARRDSHHGARVVFDGVAFELLCDPGIELPLSDDSPRRPLASVLCSVSIDLPRGAGAARPCCEWHADRATIRTPGVVASLRHLAPRRYAVTAHVDPDAGLGPLLDAVASAVRLRDAI